MVTNRDLRFETRMSVPVSEVMTPRERLVTVKEGASLEEAKALMHAHRLERVLVVDDDFNLAGLMTVKDITKATDHPFAAKDASGKLLVGAGVSVGGGTEERVEKLVDAGVDVIVVDTAPRPLPGRSEPRQVGQGTLSQPAGHRRQHRHGRCRSGSR